PGVLDAEPGREAGDREHHHQRDHPDTAQNPPQGHGTALLPLVTGFRPVARTAVAAATAGRRRRRGVRRRRRGAGAGTHARRGRGRRGRGARPAGRGDLRDVLGGRVLRSLRGRTRSATGTSGRTGAGRRAVRWLVDQRFSRKVIGRSAVHARVHVIVSSRSSAGGAPTPRTVRTAAHHVGLDQVV